MPRHMVPEAHGVVNVVAVVEHGFDPQVPFDACDRIDNDSSCSYAFSAAFSRSAAAAGQFFRGTADQ